MVGTFDRSYGGVPLAAPWGAARASTSNKQHRYLSNAAMGAPPIREWPRRCTAGDNLSQQLLNHAAFKFPVAAEEELCT